MKAVKAAMTLTVPENLINLTDADLLEFKKLHPDVQSVRQGNITFYGSAVGGLFKIVAIHKTS